MSAIPGRTSAGDLSRRLAFFKGLQALTARIHATNNIDEIIFELSADICSLFGAERITLYTVDESGAAIVSKVKTGLHSIKAIRLPISDRSVAGYVALHKTLLNIHDVYDAAELNAISPNLEFRREVDERSGYHSKQMLVAPIMGAAESELLGVVQLINARDGSAFTAIDEEGLQGLAQTLGVAFAQRLSQEKPLRNKYDYLTRTGAVSAEQLEEIEKQTRARNTTVEAILLDEVRIAPALVGESMARFYGVPYEPFLSLIHISEPTRRS